MFKKLANEFKTFAMRGNVIDMAVGIIIGAAFGKIVDSLVKDIIMPPIGLLLGSVDFTNLAREAGAVTLNIGVFINVVISFIIVAFAVFILIKAINRLQAKIDKKAKADAAKAEPVTKECPFCCTQIPVKATRCPNCTSELNK